MTSIGGEVAMSSLSTNTNTNNTNTNDNVYGAVIMSTDSTDR